MAPVSAQGTDFICSRAWGRVGARSRPVEVVVRGNRGDIHDFNEDTA